MLYVNGRKKRNILRGISRTRTFGIFHPGLVTVCQKMPGNTQLIGKLYERTGTALCVFNKPYPLSLQSDTED